MDSKKTLTMFDNTEKTVRVNTPGSSTSLQKVTWGGGLKLPEWQFKQYFLSQWYKNMINTLCSFFAMSKILISDCIRDNI